MNTEALTCFCLSCIVIFIFYPITEHIIGYRFIRLKTFDKYHKDYIVKNIIKSCCLFALCIASAKYIIPDLRMNIWNTKRIQIFASFYVSNDAVALVRVEKLPLTTRIHHIITCLFLVYVWNIDFNTSLVGQKIFVYTVCSAIAAPVNFYLGMRYLDPKNMEMLRIVCKYLYMSVIIINWTYYALTFNLETDTLIYSCLAFWLLLDDIILIKWLWRKP